MNTTNANKINLNKKIIISFFVIIFFAIQFYPIIENVSAQTSPQTDNVLVTLDVTTGITISNGADVIMSPDLGISANSSIGNSSWIVRTNSVNGYQLSVKANTAPALKSATNSFADYPEATGTCSDPLQTTKATCEAVPAIWTPTPETWNVPASTYAFGYSAYGADTTPIGKWGSGSSCGSGGVPLGTLNYAGFTTNNNIIATSNTVTSTSGATTNICFAAEQKNVYAPSGTYHATIIATAMTL